MRVPISAAYLAKSRWGCGFVRRGSSARGVIRFVLFSDRAFARGLHWFRFATSNLKYVSRCDDSLVERILVVRRWLLTLRGLRRLRACCAWSRRSVLCWWLGRSLSLPRSLSLNRSPPLHRSPSPPLHRPPSLTARQNEPEGLLPRAHRRALSASASRAPRRSDQASLLLAP